MLKANDNVRELAARNRLVIAEIVGLGLSEIALFAIAEGASRDRRFAARLEITCDDILSAYDRLTFSNRDATAIMGEARTTLEQVFAMFVAKAQG